MPVQYKDTHVARQLPKSWEIGIGKDIRGQVVTKSFTKNNREKFSNQYTN